jgi:hypothetical protein
MRPLTTGMSSSASAASARSSRRQASKVFSAMASAEATLRSRIERSAKLRLRGDGVRAPQGLPRKPLVRMML